MVKNDLHSHEILSTSDVLAASNDTMLTVGYKLIELIKTTELKKAELITMQTTSKFGWSI